LAFTAMTTLFVASPSPESGGASTCTGQPPVGSGPIGTFVNA